jgi:hypothetical protein
MGTICADATTLNFQSGTTVTYSFTATGTFLAFDLGFGAGDATFSIVVTSP